MPTRRLKAPILRLLETGIATEVMFPVSTLDKP
jgi:hypothetical protein